jgi:phosphate transport system substrate-binding protein
MPRLFTISAALLFTITPAYSQAPVGPASQQFVNDKLSRIEKFNLAGLPAYQPEQKVSGTIRSFGFSLGGMMPMWEEGFRQYQPEIRFDDKFPSGDVAIAGLVSGVSDLGPQGRELVLTENLAFYETYGYYPTDITVMTGAYDVDGMACGLVVYVNKDKPIHTYGHGPGGTTNFFELKVLNGSDKWNPNYQGYVETGSKMIADNDKAQLGGLQHMLADGLAKDKYGIAWTVIPQARKVQGLKPLALAARDGGPYIEPSRENFQNRTYPLTRSIYIYLNRKPGQALDPKVKEFLRYVLSREGQEAVERAGKYLPLTADVAREQLKKLE